MAPNQLPVNNGYNTYFINTPPQPIIPAVGSGEIDLGTAMHADDIKNHPVYLCNKRALRVGAIGTAIAAIVALSYPPPNNIYVAVATALLSLCFLMVERYVLPRILTFQALDVLVAGYCTPILGVQLLSLWCFPDVEVATGVGCMVVLSALLYHSTIVMMTYILVAVSSWFSLKLAIANFPSPNEAIQLLLIAPLVAFVARQAISSALNSLYAAGIRERNTVQELRATLEKLREETRLREITEAQLIHAQKTEGLGLMAAGVAHDFNNTLAAINSFAEVIGMATQEKDVRNHASEIVKAVKQASAVCREMLVYAGKSTSQLQPVELVELTKNMRPLLQASCGVATNINILTTEPIATVRGNAAQLQQVLLNLVNNAADAIPEKGNIEITVSRQASVESADLTAEYSFVSTDHQGEFVSLTISDSGIGMGRDTIRQMFDPYFTTKGTGHGFGLSNVLGIAKSHNASLTVQSELGQGTTIRLFFPSIEVDSAPRPAPPQVPDIDVSVKKNSQILLVDDDNLVRDSLAEILMFHGWDVVKADSGQAAIELVKHTQGFAALIIDFCMPNMNGSETLKGIRDLGCHSPAILCSGHISDPAQDAVLDQFQGFLAKPFHRLELEETLQRIVSS